jgi:hypothetical protein
MPNLNGLQRDRHWATARARTGGTGQDGRPQADRSGQAGVAGALRSGGVTGSNAVLNALARMINAERATAAPSATAPAAGR